MDNDRTVEPKPAIVLDADSEAESVSVGADLDGDGEPDVQANITIKDKRVWAIIGVIVIIVAGAKAFGIW